MKSGEVPAAATRQRGVFTVRQALDEGWTARQLKRRLAVGAWVRLAGQGVASRDLPVTATTLAWAIHLTWESAVVSHATAAMLHGFPLSPGPGIGRSRAQACLPRKAGRSASIATWNHPVPGADLGKFDSVIPVTLQKRTATDCLATLPLDQARSLFAWLVTREVVTDGDLVDALGRYRRNPGFTQLRLLRDLHRRGALSRSEEVCHEVLDAYGITGWKANERIVGSSGTVCVGDVVFPKERLLLEVDGWAYHRDRQAFERDRQVQARLAAEGWVVVRVTWRELTQEPERFAQQLRRTLEHRRRLDLGGLVAERTPSPRPVP